MEKTYLTEADIERIAELAAEKTLEKVYVEVGKVFIKRVIWVVGAMVIAVLMYLGRKGISLPG